MSAVVSQIRRPDPSPISKVQDAFGAKLAPAPLSAKEALKDLRLPQKVMRRLTKPLQMLGYTLHTQPLDDPFSDAVLNVTLAAGNGMAVYFLHVPGWILQVNAEDAVEGFRTLQYFLPDGSEVRVIAPELEGSIHPVYISEKRRLEAFRHLRVEFVTWSHVEYYAVDAAKHRSHLDTLADLLGLSPALVAPPEPGGPAPAPVPGPPPAASPAPVRNRVFISYSHLNRDWLDRVQRALRPGELSGEVARWDDSMIEAGQEWREEIMGALASTRAAILLMSQDFLGSKFIAEDELPPLLTAAAAQGATILILNVRRSEIQRPEYAALNKYQMINPPERPLNAMTEAEQDDALVDLANRVRNLLTT